MSLSRFCIEGRNDATMIVALIDIILPRDDKSIDNLIDNVYMTDEMAKAIVYVLKDLTICYWLSKWKKLI